MRAPAHEQAPLWREALEPLAFAGLPADLRRGLERALALMHRLESAELSDPLHLELLDDLLERLRECMTASAAGEAMRRLSQVEAAVRRCRAESLEAAVALQGRGGARMRPARAARLAAFRASLGVPALHALERDFLAPPMEATAVDVDAALASLERQLEEDIPLESELDVHEPPHSGDPVALHLRRLARDLAENVGAMGMLRQTTRASRHHSGIPSFEQRLLSSFDALIALGRTSEGAASEQSDRIEVLETVLAWGRDTPAVDPARAFACTFVLACVEGSDTVRAAVSLVRRSHPSLLDLHRDAFALGSNPEIDSAMQRLLGDDDSRLVRLALEVLTRRGAVDFGASALLLAHGDAAVRAAAARSLGQAPRRAAVDALEQALADETDDGAALGMVQSLILLSRKSGLEWLRRRLRAPAAAPRRLSVVERDLLLLLAIAGTRGDGEILSAWHCPDPRYAAVVGWHGSLEGVRPLLSLVGAHAAGPALRHATARALCRIAGEAPPEWESRTASPEELAAFWAARAGGLEDGRKQRFGKPLSIAGCLDELEHHDRLGGEREACAFELAVMTGAEARLEPHDWVARQREAIRAARELEAAGRWRGMHRPGEWLGERVGKRPA